MKKYVIILAILAVGSVAASRLSPLQATEVKLGVAGMYDIWKPAFTRLHEGKAISVLGTGLKHDKDGSFMLGPTLGVKFGSWQMDLTGLFGLNKNKFSYSSLNWDLMLWSLIYGSPPLLSPYVSIGDSSARRYDVDLKFAKRIHKFFNFNIGGRFNYADGAGSQFRIYVPSTLFDYAKDEYRFWQVGPILGIGFIAEIKGLTIYANVNGIINFGNNYLERSSIRPDLRPFLVPYEYDTYHLGFGFDTDAGLAYFIAPAHLSIGAGFRWVGVVCASVDDDGSVMDLGYHEGWMSGEWDHFYGVTFNVSFKF